MTDRMQYGENDPRHHTAKIKQMLRDVAAHAREDVTKVSDPKAQALFETTAEVCSAWKRPIRILKTGTNGGGREPRANTQIQKASNRYQAWIRGIGYP